MSYVGMAGADARDYFAEQNISPQVLIMTRSELRVMLADEFLRGQAAGKLETATGAAPLPAWATKPPAIETAPTPVKKALDFLRPLRNSVDHNSLRLGVREAIEALEAK